MSGVGRLATLAAARRVPLMNTSKAPVFMMLAMTVEPTNQTMPKAMSWEDVGEKW